MLPKLTNRTRRIGVRVQEAVFDRIRQCAANHGKTASEWCSERLSEIARGVPSVFEQALMAEIAATQNITITLLYEMAEGRKLSRERVQEILDSAHAAKYGDADERLKHALADMPEAASVGSRARR